MRMNHSDSVGATRGAEEALLILMGPTERNVLVRFGRRAPAPFHTIQQTPLIHSR